MRLSLRWHGFEEEWIDSKTRLLRYNQQISITDMVSMTCYPSGHQIGGAIYEIMDKKLSKKVYHAIVIIGVF